MCEYLLKSRKKLYLKVMPAGFHMMSAIEKKRQIKQGLFFPPKSSRSRTGCSIPLIHNLSACIVWRLCFVITRLGFHTPQWYIEAGKPIWGTWVSTFTAVPISGCCELQYFSTKQQNCEQSEHILITVFNVRQCYRTWVLQDAFAQNKQSINNRKALHAHSKAC